MAKTASDHRSRYLVGIDLGTTHTAVAWLDTRQQDQGIQLFYLDQLVAAGEVSMQPLLPSVRYHPCEDEIATADCVLPWQTVAFGDPVHNSIVGEWARSLGAKSHGRLVTSAKSWLSNEAVDRAANILPWGTAEDIPKISPVLASASYLNHVRCAWNLRFKNAPLEKQDVFLTIPASFDEAARQYTLQAAQIAGISQVRLLEEPLTACYHWTYQNKDHLADELKNIHLLLVCDIGGGTTDFTLIQVQPNQEHSGGQPRLTRIGVGDHLMLGGDNIDLAIARLAEHRLSPNQPLKMADLHQLIEQCRIAKEQLLANQAPEDFTVTLLGSGSQLIGNAKSTRVTRDEIRSLVMDGFFPHAQLEALPERQRTGVVEFGLPYASDPAMTRHIADFLVKHQKSIEKVLGNDQTSLVPDAILLNGGVFKSPVVVDTLLDRMQNWTEQKVTHLQNQHPEFAVAYGAVAYGLASRGQHVKIGGGSARSFFVEVESKGQVKKAVCVLPKGTEEGSAQVLVDRIFALQLGQPVRFHLLSTTDDTEYKPGQLVDVSNERFHGLPPLATLLGKNEKGEVAVNLSAELSDLGVLELSCVDEQDSNKRWKLSFGLRNESRIQAGSDVGSHPQLAKATALIQTVFGKKSQQVEPKAVKQLRGNLESLLGKRTEWDTGLLRALHDELLAGAKNRRRSVHHERVWLSLAGFCLRPGWGYPLDDWRCEQLWGLHQQGLQYVNEIQPWTEWWTMWRRIAGGLDQDQQLKLYRDVAKYIDPASARMGKTAAVGKKRGYDEMVRMVASLEHLPVVEKVRIGNWLLKRLKKPSEPALSWWALSRVGARVPFYGSTHNVVSAEIVEKWLAFILSLTWKKDAPFAFAAALLARKSGDRVRDISPETSRAVVDKLQSIKASQSWVDMVEQVIELEESDQRMLYGDALPVGLKLLQ
ncbi:MAG TPA: molecular chaperone DnaK [Crenotrichaceae bacterium]|nr:molecular chaperone DnaK [Crenotrichaceae bacterium]